MDVGFFLLGTQVVWFNEIRHATLNRPTSCNFASLNTSSNLIQGFNWGQLLRLKCGLNTQDQPQARACRVSKRTTGNRAYNLNGALNRTSVPSLVSAQYRDLSRSRAWVFGERTTNYRTHHTAKTSYTPPAKNTATLSLKGTWTLADHLRQLKTLPDTPTFVGDFWQQISPQTGPIAWCSWYPEPS